MASVTYGQSQTKNIKQGVLEIKHSLCRVLLFCPAFDFIPHCSTYAYCTDTRVFSIGCPPQLSGVCVCGCDFKRKETSNLLCSDSIKHYPYPLKWVGKLFSSAPSPWFNTVVPQFLQPGGAFEEGQFRARLSCAEGSML